MQVCWHFKKGLHWNWQGYFRENSVNCRKQYKAPTNSIRKLTICIDNAGPLFSFGDLHCTNTTYKLQIFKQFSKSFLKNLPLFISAKKYFQFNLFLAQQWRLTPEGKLENKLRNWAHGKKNSTQIPSYGMQGRINIREKFGQKTILTFPYPSQVQIMKYEKISDKHKSFQTWEIGYPDVEGWFNISSQKAKNKYLAVTKIGNYNQLTMEEGKFAELHYINFYYCSFLLSVK